MCFGILKQRFLFLENQIQIHNPKVIDDLFVTCCALHNVLLDYDGCDNWEETILEDDECMNAQHGILETIGRLNSGSGSQCRNNNDEIYFLIDINQNDDEYDYRTTNEEAAKHHARHDDLVEHYRTLRNHRVLSLRR